MAGKCRVEFDNVSFSYVPDSPVLKGVSFQCHGGQTLALVGATGALPAVQGLTSFTCLYLLSSVPFTKSRVPVGGTLQNYEFVMYGHVVAKASGHLAGALGYMLQLHIDGNGMRVEGQ